MLQAPASIAMIMIIINYSLSLHQALLNSTSNRDLKTGIIMGETVRGDIDLK